MLYEKDNLCVFSKYKNNVLLKGKIVTYALSTNLTESLFNVEYMYLNIITCTV